MIISDVTYGQLHTILTKALEQDPSLKDAPMQASIDMGSGCDVHVWNTRRDMASEEQGRELDHSNHPILHIPFES